MGDAGREGNPPTVLELEPPFRIGVVDIDHGVEDISLGRHGRLLRGLRKVLGSRD